MILFIIAFKLAHSLKNNLRNKLQLCYVHFLENVPSNQVHNVRCDKHSSQSEPKRWQSILPNYSFQVLKRI